MKIPLPPGIGAVARAASAPIQVVQSLVGAVLPGDAAASELDRRDPEFMREWLPALWVLAGAYFRAEIRNIENIPRTGPVLLVCNHTGGVQSPEILVNMLAFPSYWGVERPFYSLSHALVAKGPAGGFLGKFGSVEASSANARAALSSGAAVIVYPGGDYEVFRPSWDSAKVDFDGRKGWIRLALEQNVPIAPLVTIGGQETSLFLSRGEWLAKALRLDKALRLKVLPIMATFPWGLNIGINAGIPLPSKIVVDVLEPVDLRAKYGDDPDVDVIYDDILSSMQAKLTQLASERKYPVFG